MVARDVGDLTDSLEVTVEVTDQNEGPTVSGISEFTFQENRDPTLVLATYTGSDPESPGTPITRWSLSGTDGGDFLINENGELRFRNTPDFDQPADSNRDSGYQFAVRASDGRYYGYLDVAVTVTNLNEHTPVVTGSNRRTVRENTISSLYTYRASDQDRGDTVTWSVAGTDGQQFDISEQGVLTFKTPPDYDIPGDSGRDNQYDIEVEAEDSEGLSGSLTVAVIVTAVDEGPRISGPSAFTIDENQDLPGATYTANDPEGVTSFHWSTSGRDGGDFTIGENGVLSFRNTPDHERPVDSNRDNLYELSVRAYDGWTYGYFPVTVTVNEVNEPPVVTGRDTITYRENGTSSIYTYRATDPERDSFTWSLGGPDAVDFNITERGVLTFASPPDFERPAGTNGNEYHVTVVAMDNGTPALSGRFDVTVTVTDQNEGPTVSGQATFIVRENWDPAFALGAYTATDPENSGVTRWSLSGSDGGDFVIGELGELRFRYVPDYDRPADSNQDNEYRFTVRAYDGRYYGYQDVAVTVDPENEHDPVVSGRNSLTVRENTTSSLYTYRATDQDRDTVISWSVAGDDRNDFEISDRGVLTFKSPPDYERPADLSADNQYNIAVVAEDDGGILVRSGFLSVLITVTDQNEGPEITGRQTLTAAENQATSVALATYSATDPEDTSAAITRWSLSGTDGGDFVINDQGELRFRYTPDYDRPADSNRDNIYQFCRARLRRQVLRLPGRNVSRLQCERACTGGLRQKQLELPGEHHRQPVHLSRHRPGPRYLHHLGSQGHGRWRLPDQPGCGDV